jgi:hypothetical protein
MSPAGFKLPLRQTESLTAVLMLISLTLEVPDHNTMSGRALTFAMTPADFWGAISKESFHSISLEDSDGHGVMRAWSIAEKLAKPKSCQVPKPSFVQIRRVVS